MLFLFIQAILKKKTAIVFSEYATLNEHIHSYHQYFLTLYAVEPDMHLAEKCCGNLCLITTEIRVRPESKVTQHTAILQGYLEKTG